MIRAPHQIAALVLGVGLAPFAPGTAGSVAGFALFALMQLLPVPARVIAYLALAMLAVWACEKSGKDLKAPDHGAMVIDEVIAMSLVLEFVQPGAWSFLFAFLLFRLFDILKPWPISYVDRRWTGGVFVLADDLLAAVYTIVVMRVVLQPLLG